MPELCDSFVSSSVRGEIRALDYGDQDGIAIH
jgi:hypothetical protein